MPKIFKNQRGVAYLLVIAAIALITPIVFDFFDETLVSRDLSLNRRRWLQAYYLAKSGVNFQKLVLSRHKKKLTEYAKNATALQYLSTNPIYKQVQLSTEMLRSLVNMRGVEAGEEEGQHFTDTVGEEDEGKTLLESPGLSETVEIEEFLNFKGDFDTEISEEQSKFSVNAFAKITPTSTGFDLHKKILHTLLIDKELKNFFHDHEKDAQTLAQSIADYVDANNVINEYDNIERGVEDSTYTGLDYSSKNAPLMTLSELRLVPGMSDDILEFLKPTVTVFHSGDEVNVCLADQAVVDALIVHYTANAKCTDAIEASDSDYLEDLRTEMLAACPDKDDVANALNVKLGLKERPMEEASTAETKTTSSMIAECELQNVDLLTEDNNIFRIKSHGQVDGVEATIETVIDAANKRPSAWGTLYYQVF